MKNKDPRMISLRTLRWTLAGGSIAMSGLAQAQQLVLVAEIRRIGNSTDARFAEAIGIGDGRLVVSTSNAGEPDRLGVRVYSADTGVLLESIGGHPGLSFSNPGLSIDDGVVVLPGFPIGYRQFDNPSGSAATILGVDGVPFLREGKIAVFLPLAGSIVEPFMGPPLSSFQFNHESYVGFPGIAFDGRYAASGDVVRLVNGNFGAGAVGIVDTLTGQVIADFPAPQPSWSGAFGGALAMRNGDLVVSHLRPGSASGSDWPDPGEVYLYDASTAELIRTFHSPSGVAVDGGTQQFPSFGVDVDISDNFIAVGEPFLDGFGLTDVGAVYLFDRHTGSLLATVRPETPYQNDRFGRILALSDTHLAVVSNPSSSDRRVHLYRIDPPPKPCLADTNGDGLVTPADFSAWIAAFNAQSPACDQNSDGLCTAADFSAWIQNFNAGCP